MAKTSEKQANKVIRDTEDELDKLNRKMEIKMKKLTINPQVKGAFKTLFVIGVIAGAFYAGTQYQEQYHTQVTSEAKVLVTQLKIKQ